MNVLYLAYYVSAFLCPNVELVCSSVSAMSSSGVTCSDGSSHDVDVVVMATGFDLIATYSAFRAYGVNGVCLQDVWGECPRAYLGITVPGKSSY